MEILRYFKYHTYLHICMDVYTYVHTDTYVMCIRVMSIILNINKDQ